MAAAIFISAFAVGISLMLGYSVVLAIQESRNYSKEAAKAASEGREYVLDKPVMS